MTIQTKVIYNYIFGNTRNIILGAGLYFAIEKKRIYTHSNYSCISNYLWWL
jgi:hypothetical protein